MKPEQDFENLCWEAATGLPTAQEEWSDEYLAALVPDSDEKHDHVAVIYQGGKEPPQITIDQVSDQVHTVFANGIPVAVVASADGYAPAPEDVLLVEHFL